MTQKRQRQPWKTAADVERLTVSERKIGGGGYGTSFVGKIDPWGIMGLPILIEIAGKI